MNTLAGSGTLITLPILMMTGLPAAVANGTNRLGILFQTAVATFTQRKMAKEALIGSWVFIVPAILGAVIGAKVAVKLDDTTLKWILGSIMVIMLLLTLTNSDKWLRENSDPGSIKNKGLMFVLFLAVGFWGGFIQAGTGLFMLFFLIMAGNRTVSHSNFLKNAIVLAFTIPSLIIFIYNDQVAWKPGLIMTAGQITGSYAASIFAMRAKKINVIVRYLLTIIIFGALIEISGFRTYIFGMLFQ